MIWQPRIGSLQSPCGRYRITVRGGRWFVWTRGVDEAIQAHTRQRFRELIGREPGKLEFGYGEPWRLVDVTDSESAARALCPDAPRVGSGAP